MRRSRFTEAEIVGAVKQVEEEDRRLKKLVADLSLDKEALNDALARKW